MSKEQRVLPVPDVWSYIVVSLDPQTTVKLACGGVDDTASKEIAEKTGGFKKYVGFCEKVVESLPMPDREFHRIHWRPLQKGLTRSTPQQPCEPHMCVPVLPTAEHPHNRKPMRTSKPLPWSNLYHPTEPYFVFRVDNKFIDYTDCPQINPYDEIYLGEKVQLDGDRIDELLEAKEAGTEPPELQVVLDREEDMVMLENIERRENALEEEARKKTVGEPSLPQTQVAVQHTDDTEQAAPVQNVSGVGVAHPVADDGAPDDDAAETKSVAESMKELGPVFRQMLNCNYADPADDDFFTPTIQVSTNLDEINDQDFPDFHDLFAEYEILEGIVNRAKERVTEAEEAFYRENVIENMQNAAKMAEQDLNEPAKPESTLPEAAPSEHPNKGFLRKIPHPKISLPKLPGPVVKAMDKVKNLYKDSLLDRSISKSKLWVRETAGRVARCGKEKDIAS